MISGAIGGSSDWGSCFYSANPNKGYGNPLEAGAHAVEIVGKLDQGAAAEQHAAREIAALTPARSIARGPERGR